MPEPVIEIEIKKGYKAKIDLIDAENVLKHSWYVSVRNGKFYIYGTPNKKHTSMHRFIMGLDIGDKAEVDHIDNDGLNNTRKNLRLCNRSQNQMNRSKSTNCKSIYKGVTIASIAHWRKKKWTASVKFNGKKHSLGYFLTQEDAALAYNKKAKELFGEFAKLNQIG